MDGGLMSNTQRPSAARKVTRTSEANRENALDQGLRITLDGEVFEVRVGDITSTLARELRGHVGFGPMQLIRHCAVDPDVDLLSAFVWLARRISGEFVRFEDVEVSYAQLLSDGFDVATPGDAEPDPEA
jgi:hypothetical protein